MNKRQLRPLLLTALVTAMVTPVAAWDWRWVRQFDSTVFIGAYGGVADSSGVYVSGGVFGDLAGATTIGGTDAYVRKLDHAGAVLWTRRVGTTGYDDSQSVAADGDGAYIAGITCGALPGQVPAGRCDTYVARLSPDGALMWATQFGTAAFDAPYQYDAIAVHASAVYVAGKTDGTFPGAPPAGGPNTFLARLDRSTGAVLWVRQFGAADPGFFGAGGVGADDTGVAVVANSENTSGAGRWEAEVRKYDSHGVVQWATVFHESAPPCGHPVFGLTSHRGRVYLIGQTYESAMATCETQSASNTIGLLQTLDAAGNLLWQRRIKGGTPGVTGGTGFRFTGGKVVHVTDEGIFVAANVGDVDFAGQVSRVPHRDRSQCGDPGLWENAFFRGLDGYVRRYDLDGNVLWTHQFGSSLYELVSGLGTDGGRIYAAGLTRCAVEEGTDPESGALVDAFVVSLAMDPTTQTGRVQLIVGQIETLSDAGRIASGDFNALVGHLESVLAALDQSKANVAKASLNTFATLVGNYRAMGRLTAAEADALISAAGAIAGEL